MHFLANGRRALMLARTPLEEELETKSAGGIRLVGPAAAELDRWHTVAAVEIELQSMPPPRLAQDFAEKQAPNVSRFEPELIAGAPPTRKHVRFLRSPPSLERPSAADGFDGAGPEPDRGRRLSASSDTQSHAWDVHLSEVSVVPYSEIYGVHPSLFAFTTDGGMCSANLDRGDALAQLLRLIWPLLLSPPLLGTCTMWYTQSTFGFTDNDVEVNAWEGAQRQKLISGLALQCICRFLGGLLLGHLADVKGRKVVAIVSLVGMMIGTVGQALVPGQFAPIPHPALDQTLTFLLRALHAASLAGDVSATVCYLLEMADPRTMGLAICLLELGYRVGNFYGSGMVCLMRSLLSEAAMLSWGWRVPLVMCGIPGLLAFRGRKRVPESVAILAEMAQATQRPATGCQGCLRGALRGFLADVRELLTLYRPAILVGFLGSSSSVSLWYFAAHWVFKNRIEEEDISHTAACWLGCAMKAVSFLAVIVAGLLADVQGVGWAHLAASSCCAVLPLPTYALFSCHPHNFTVAFVCEAVVMGWCLGFGSGNIGFLVAELFPTRLRGLGVALTLNPAVCCFFVLHAVASDGVVRCYPRFGPSLVIALASLCTALTILWALRLEREDRLQLAHRRKTPYFGAVK